MTGPKPIVEVYNVAPTDEGRVRLEMIINRAEFPAFAVDFEPRVALRIAEALVANAYQFHGKAPLGIPPQGASHGT